MYKYVEGAMNLRAAPEMFSTHSGPGAYNAETQRMVAATIQDRCSFQ